MAEISETETKQYHTINETSLYFDQVSNIDKCLSNMTKRKRPKLIKLETKKINIKDIKGIIRD
jgi:hypothetical protein